MKALAPVTPAQFSSPGLARSSAANSFSELAGEATGTVMPTKVLETRAIGARSSGLYGRLSCRNGCAVNAEVGDISRTWSSLAPTKAAMATMPSPPGLFSITTDWFHFLASRSTRSRAPMSVPLPGPSVRMKRTERVGQACG